MFIDMHAHTSGISTCCRVDYRKIIETAKDAGYDAIVLTNHYTNSYFTEESHDAWIEKYINEFYDTENYGKALGIKVFFGIEVTYEENPHIHLLIYGADVSFLRENRFLCEKSQKELYEICHRNDCILIQAHPFRYGDHLMDLRYLDGLEINCHPLYGESYSKKIAKIAKENNIALTVGCDYHADTHRAVAGIFLPDSINTERELADYIINSEKREIQIEEPADRSIRRIFFNE